MTPDLLPRDVAPPAALEEATVARLRAQGWLRASNRAGLRGWAQAAAALVVFALGGAAGAAWTRPSPEAPGKPRYLFLLSGVSAATAADERRAVEDYRDWAVRLRREGRFVSGERLGPAAVSVPDGRAPSDADVQGFFLVSADRLEDAVAIARSSPHARRGGRVVVRPIDTP